MALRRVVSVICVVVFFAAVCSLAIAGQITAGSGQNSVGLYVEWSDGYIADFCVKFDSPTVSGLNLFDIVEAETSLTTLRQDYGFGVFINGITYNGHSNSGYGGGADWWHYWVKNSGQAEWLSPGYGASDRAVYNGDYDGWVYGRDGEPVPEPAAIVLFGLGGLMLRKRRQQLKMQCKN
jgi:hypothetical protein